jgi:hypothetical protein
MENDTTYDPVKIASNADGVRDKQTVDEKLANDLKLQFQQKRRAIACLKFERALCDTV